MQSSEGEISFAIPGVKEQCFTWYKTVGDIKRATPLIFLHGGPGAGHEDHFHLAETLESGNIPTIWYDQIGCGNSSRIMEKAEDEKFWGLDLFCAELDNLVDSLGLRDGFYLLGHSWGGMLASTYAGRQPRGLKKLVIACSMANSTIVNKELERLFRALPVSDEVMQMDADEDYDNPVYQEARDRFVKKHFCTLDPLPPVLTSAKWEDSTKMWPSNGRKGFSMIRKPGFMGRYDATETAGNINVPVLLLSGRHDTNNDVIMRPWFELVPRVKWAVLEKSAHFPALEEPERYAELLKSFLAQAP
ncbi:uncharacterized protein PV06_04123 [Exophiala oligosperma]|uniref:AB hydrolase-1 domain-containing protein n=1 Tax=Exophiala oligosperma TaxID=215243 RepID=A0A0D2C7H5_9EURO|nr:uncharacterized protein PV06_04123 [Exophiala oligosperma]KIW45767.1 hypothetical protein PV06_04123 [Exophiala oligosperma]